VCGSTPKRPTPASGTFAPRTPTRKSTIVEAADRSTIAIEAKLTDTIRPADVEHLNWLAEQLGDRLVDQMIIHTGQHAYRRPDGIAIVPLALLGP